MNQKLPLLATVLGLGGLIPFAAMGFLALGPEEARAGLGLVAYGAVILAFLGAVHWGFALAEPGGSATSARLALGVLPSLVGWVAVLFTVGIGIDAALGLLIVSFVGLTVMEARARTMGLMPAGYMRLRYALSGGVVFILASVVLLHLVGAHTTL